MTEPMGRVWHRADDGKVGSRPSSSMITVPPSMTIVPPGTFVRGSDLSPDEQPVSQITMSSFAIDIDPVCNKDFAHFIAAGGYQRPNLWVAEGWNYINTRQLTEPTYWRDPIWAEPDAPVTGVSWWEALAFARFVGKTLPTEAQWEYAARGSDARTYPWGEDEPDANLANYAPECEPIDRRPTKPGAHPAATSTFGCRDMVGNFAEWCLDSYRPFYDADSSRDPVYLADDSTVERVVRGGSGLHDEDYLRCAARDHYPVGLRDNLIGFRCVLNFRESK
jgi:gamma-glutamyl hercynylcysteine S-oxide synthase